MLYQDPATIRPISFIRRLRLSLALLARHRRQKLAEIHLLTANRTLRQDLGLDDISLFRR